MTKNLKKSLVLFCLFAIVYTSIGQTAEKKLVKTDIDNFVNKIPKLITDFKEKGAEIDAKEGEIYYPEAFQYSQEFKKILNKNNVTEADFEKFAYILQGYAVIMYNEEMDSDEPQLREALTAMENNPYLSQEQITQIKASVQEGHKIMEEAEDDIHPSDIELIKSNMDRISEVIESE